MVRALLRVAGASGVATKASRSLTVTSATSFPPSSRSNGGHGAGTNARLRRSLHPSTARSDHAWCPQATKRSRNEPFRRVAAGEPAPAWPGARVADRHRPPRDRARQTRDDVPPRARLRGTLRADSAAPGPRRRTEQTRRVARPLRAAQGRAARCRSIRRCPLDRARRTMSATFVPSASRQALDRDRNTRGDKPGTSSSCNAVNSDDTSRHRLRPLFTRFSATSGAQGVSLRFTTYRVFRSPKPNVTSSSLVGRTKYSTGADPAAPHSSRLGPATAQHPPLAPGAVTYSASGVQTCG